MIISVTETSCGDFPQRPVEGCWEKIRISCKLGFLMTSVVVVDSILFCYLSLVALATVHLVGDNREFDVWDTF